MPIIWQIHAVKNNKLFKKIKRAHHLLVFFFSLLKANHNKKMMWFLTGLKLCKATDAQQN